MPQLTMGQALNQALREEMTRDDTVFIAGEGVGVSIHDNPMLPTAGLLRDFGPRRVRDTPVSEAAIAGLAVGAAEAGLKPVVEIMFNPFFTLASVRKTGRLLVLHEATRTGGFAGEVAAVVMEEAFGSLKAPLRRVTGPDIPVPASPPLERFYIPDAGQVVTAAKDLVSFG